METREVMEVLDISDNDRINHQEEELETFPSGFPETDVTLIVEDQKFHVSRAVLSQHSPVFNAMFNGHFKESTEKEIVLEDKKAEQFEEFLKSFYPNMKHPLTEKNVLHVLPLAHEYQSSLVGDCEKLMIQMCQPGTKITVSTLLDYILAAEKFNLTKFLETAANYAARVDYDLLLGNTFEKTLIDWPNLYELEMSENKDISSKFSQINIKTRLLIAEKRLLLLEMNRRKRDNEISVNESDHKLPLK